MKCIILDYIKNEVRVISIDETQADEIEDLLIENYEYSLGNIDYMLFEDELKLIIE